MARNPQPLAAFGALIDILPGAGTNIAALFRYNALKSACDDPARLGKPPQGVAAGKHGYNSDSAASMVPALTSGIPGNVIAEPVLEAPLIDGLQSGPSAVPSKPLPRG